MEHLIRSLSALCIFSSENYLVISFAYLSNISIFCTLRVSNSRLMHGSATDGLVSSQRYVSRRLVRVLMSKGTLGITEACKPEQNSAHPISRDTSCPRNLIVLDINLLGSYWRSSQEVKRKLQLFVWVGQISLRWSFSRAQHWGAGEAPAVQDSRF